MNFFVDRSGEIADVLVALAKANHEVENALKNSKNPAFRSDYADINAVLEEVKPIYKDHKLSVMQMPSMEGDKTTLYTLVVHEGGQYVVFPPAMSPIAKNDAQGVGSAITYLRRYSLSTLANIASDDDDGNRASHVYEAYALAMFEAQSLEQLQEAFATAYKKLAFDKKAQARTKATYEKVRDAWFSDEYKKQTAKTEKTPQPKEETTA